MSTNSHRKGYTAEHDIEVLLQNRYPRLADNILRPRAGAVRDKGDIHGLPVVISVKNWAEPNLGPWVDQMKQMCHHANKGVGVVWHKRRGLSRPEDWYVTTDDMSYALMNDKYQGTAWVERAGIVVSSTKLSGWLRVTETHRERTASDIGVLVHSRRITQQEHGMFVTMTGSAFLALLDDYAVTVGHG